VQKEQLPISSPILISNSTELEQPPPKIRPDKKPKERPAVIPAYKVFTEITNYFPITNYWRNEMAAIVGELPEDLEFWRKVVIGWTGKYPSKHNVEGMLDFYKRREIPGYQNGNGASKNGHNQTYQSQIEVRDAPGSPAPGHAEYANGQGRGSGKTGKSASDALKSIARTGSRAIGPPLPVLPELANPPNRDIPAT
jgi:hypothetical protein